MCWKRLVGEDALETAAFVRSFSSAPDVCFFEANVAHFYSFSRLITVWRFFSRVAPPSAPEF